MNTVPPGEWHDYRRDDSRLGFQPLGRNPASAKLGITERWSLWLGGSFQEIVPVEDGSGDFLMADGGGVQRMTAQGEFKWRTKPFGAHWITGVFDLDGNDRLEILTSNGCEVIILCAETGKILFRDTVGPPISYGTYATMFNVHSFWGDGMQILVPCFSSKEVFLYDCSGGDARTTKLRHRLWMDDSYHPTIAIGDVNHDGVDEIVIARIGGVYVFDPKSGFMVSQTIWKSDEERRRNYGHFELADVNGDGTLEAVIISDRVSRHIAVLGNDGHGNFQPLWDRFIQHIYPTDSTELRYTANSIRDFDGDGKFEIAVSIFNERNDGHWYTELLKAETGERILELPDRYLRGVQDTNDDGFPELCLSMETTRHAKNYGELSIYSCNEERQLWSQPKSHFAECAVRALGPRAEFKPEIFGAQEVTYGEFGKHGIFIQSLEQGLMLLDTSLSIHCVYGLNQLKTNQAYRIAYITNESLYLSYADGEIIRVMSQGAEHFMSCGYHLTTEAHIAARPGSIPTVVSWNNDRYLVVPDFANNILVFRSEGVQEPTLLTSFRGRSRLGYDNIFHVASIVDTKDGPRIVVVEDEYLPYSQLSLYSLNGDKLKSYTFTDMPPSAPGNRIGCYDWLYFEHSRGEAIVASFYKSQSMNSECTLAFLLATGEILWRNDHTGEGEYGRGVGPWGTSSFVHGEGVPVAAFCAKDTLCFLDLEHGIFFRVPKLLTDYTADQMKRENRLKEQSLSTSSSVDDPFTAYGTPINYGDDLIIGGCLGGLGVLDGARVPKWWRIASFGDVLYRLPGIADIDGDGRLELGQGHADRTFRIYDYESGSERAIIQLHAISTDVLTFDANGDGRMEFVFGTSDGCLLTIGYDGSNFGILDGIETDSVMGSPIAADLVGNGNPQILAVTGDGRVRSYA